MKVVNSFAEHACPKLQAWHGIRYARRLLVSSVDLVRFGDSPAPYEGIDDFYDWERVSSCSRLVREGVMWARWA